MNNEDYQKLLFNIQKDLPVIMGDKYKSLWLLNIANGKTDFHDKEFTLEKWEKRQSITASTVTIIKYILRYFILRFLFKPARKTSPNVYIGYFVDVDARGVSNHLSGMNLEGYDIVYWYISSANSFRDLLKKKFFGLSAVDVTLMECYCTTWALCKNIWKSCFIYFSIPITLRRHSSYLTVLDVLNKIEAIETLVDQGYERIGYLSEQYVWEDMLNHLSKGVVKTEANCHNPAAPNDLRLNNLSCFMTTADTYLVKYRIQQMMLKEVEANIKIIPPPRQKKRPNNGGCNKKFLVFGHFFPKTNRMSVDIANLLAQHYEVSFKPHPSGASEGLLGNVKIISSIDKEEDFVSVCSFPTGVIEYCFEHSLPILIVHNNRFDQTAVFLDNLGIPFVTYSDIERGIFLSSIDPNSAKLKGVYAKA